jgi:hypothetical protein
MLLNISTVPLHKKAGNRVYLVFLFNILVSGSGSAFPIPDPDLGEPDLGEPNPCGSGSTTLTSIIDCRSFTYFCGKSSNFVRKTTDLSDLGKRRFRIRKYGKSDPDPLQTVLKFSIRCISDISESFSLYSEGSDPPEDLEVDSVPPYEDRLGPDGAEGENPVLPPQVPLSYRPSILHSQIFHPSSVTFISIFMYQSVPSCTLQFPVDF